MVSFCSEPVRPKLQKCIQIWVIKTLRKARGKLQMH